MNRPRELERVLAATGWNLTRSAAQLGLAPSTLAYQLRRHGIQRPAPPAAPIERHPPVTALAADLEQLRLEARLLCRAYRPCVFRAQQLRRIEYRQRLLRDNLSQLLAPHPTDTRARSLAAFGLADAPAARWQGQV